MVFLSCILVCKHFANLPNAPPRSGFSPFHYPSISHPITLFREAVFHNNNNLTDSGLEEFTPPKRKASRAIISDQQEENLQDLLGELEREESSSWLTWLQTIKNQLLAMLNSKDPNVGFVGFVFN